MECHAPFLKSLANRLVELPDDSQIMLTVIEGVGTIVITLPLPTSVFRPAGKGVSAVLDGDGQTPFKHVAIL